MAGHQSYEAAGELLRALAAPVRIAIVTELARGPRCVHDLVDALGVAQPLVSQHLRVLRGAGVVRGARRGREIAYSLVDEHVAHIVADAISHAGEPGRPAVEPAQPAEEAHHPASDAHLPGDTRHPGDRDTHHPRDTHHRRDAQPGEPAATPVPDAVRPARRAPGAAV